MKKLNIILLAFSLLLVSSAFTRPKGGNGDDVSNILQSIPSPIEISFLIKEISSQYNGSSLNNPKFVENYTMSHKKALNLGIYSTDLGYANLYEKNQDVINYLDAVRSLANGLNIGQFFDYDAVKKLASSSSNLPELLKQTQQNMDLINKHLKDQNRENMSILILTGSWIEAMYLTTLVYEQTPNVKLKEKIGEQKIAVEQIQKVLDFYKTQPNFEGIVADMKQLSLVYSKITIATSKGKSLLTESNGALVYNSDAVSSVQITDKDISLITSLVKGVRGKMVK
ncbi:MAG: hypothetical protein EAZ97_08960 [Bacteroidetes bacterium]|nr:MAG: hypothetical protein EAZ97_08960 [Bacteroidota bacterium]